jgi:AcrR family transcriptional regulator
MARALAKKEETSTTLLEAAKKVLRQNGYAGLSTRDVAAAAHDQRRLGQRLFDPRNCQLLAAARH